MHSIYFQPTGSTYPIMLAQYTNEIEAYEMLPCKRTEYGRVMGEGIFYISNDKNPHPQANWSARALLPKNTNTAPVVKIIDPAVSDKQKRVLTKLYTLHFLDQAGVLMP